MEHVLVQIIAVVLRISGRDPVVLLQSVNPCVRMEDTVALQIIATAPQDIQEGIVVLP